MFFPFKIDNVTWIRIQIPVQGIWIHNINACGATRFKKVFLK